MYHYVKNLIEDKLKVSIVLEYPKNKDFGHYATPVAFSMAKIHKKNPIILAEEISTSLSNIQDFEKVQALNGYINITLSDKAFLKFSNDLIREGFAEKQHLKNKNFSQKILIEYVSANPTGPLHIGHARGAVYGDSLKRVGEFLGHKIDTEYYINDAGSQIQMLGLSIYLAGRELLGLQVGYPEEYYRGEYIIEIAKEAQKEFGNIVFEDDSNVSKLSEFGKNLMLEEIKLNLSDIGIEFDFFVSEKSLFPSFDVMLKKLQEHNATYEKEGKVWLKSSEYGDEKDRVIIRENQEPTYLAGDIIYHNDKFARGYDRYINIWGADHHGYIARIKAAIHFLGYDEKKLEILLSQMVNLLKNRQPYKMSKRAGNFILMKDVVNDIGGDSLRFIFLSKTPNTKLEFDVEDFKKQDSSNPVFYIDYANARIHTLIEKSSLSDEEIYQATFENSSKEAKNLLFEALSLNRVVEMAYEEMSLQKICEYLKSLASNFHTYYNASKIIGTPQEAQMLKICKIISISITKGLYLLGIKAKTKM